MPDSVAVVNDGKIQSIFLHNIVLDQFCHLHSQITEVHRAHGLMKYHFKFAPLFMRNKNGSKFFGVRIDIEAQLYESRKPDIFRPDGRVIKRAVSMEDPKPLSEEEM